MNIHHLLLIEGVLKEVIVQLASLPQIERAINYDLRSDVLSKLRTVFDIYSSFFIKAGLLEGDMDYCSHNFAEIVDLDVLTEHHTLNKAIKFLKTTELPPGKLYFSIVPVHIRLSQEDSYVLLTGVAGKEVSSDTGIIVMKEITIKKNILDYTSTDIEYLEGIFKTYDPQKYKSLRDFAQANNLQYKRLQQDCQTCFNSSFYQMYLKMKLTSSLSAILFSSQPLKKIAADNDFGNYNRMYEAFGKVGIVPSDLPRFNSSIS